MQERDTSFDALEKRYAISWFFHELGVRHCFSLTQISPQLIVQACTKITDRNLWGEVRLFLRYLALEEKLDTDYSTLVPHYSKPYVIPDPVDHAWDSDRCFMDFIQCLGCKYFLGTP